MTQSEETIILIIDDEALHLKLYTWILERQGYKCKTALVKSTQVEMPKDAASDLVLLDYRLNSSVTALDVVHQLRSTFDSVPIVVLSDMQWMPDDMRGHAAAFINKGDPKLLLETIAKVLKGKSPLFPGSDA
ncbi:MAG: response regulator [Candidatus Angelobacter sp.]